jgi:hypothetical protein
VYDSRAASIEISTLPRRALDTGQRAVAFACNAWLPELSTRLPRAGEPSHVTPALRVAIGIARLLSCSLRQAGLAVGAGLYGLRRRRTGSGRGRFQASCFFPTPAAINSRAMLSTTKTDAYESRAFISYLLRQGSPFADGSAIGSRPHLHDVPPPNDHDVIHA